MLLFFWALCEVSGLWYREVTRLSGLCFDGQSRAAHAQAAGRVKRRLRIVIADGLFRSPVQSIE